MYLITAYFDESTNRQLQRIIDGIAVASGNDFMTANNVPPHLTITAFETRDPNGLVPTMDRLKEELSCGDIHLVSVGTFLPYVMYVTPVLNLYLQDMAIKVHEAVKGCGDIAISKYYQPTSWFPHITLAKTLEKEQMQQAFFYVQDHFAPIKGKIVELGLARTNPHEDIARVTL
ncbi:MAG: 2'-5' RNA ligase family protein [Lachnospiraceae bacterium]|nr:2'-5' RNA ligase family protein [Lachnospiraceae bacterium]